VNNFQMLNELLFEILDINKHNEEINFS
jgi:hypothetical protein